MNVLCQMSEYINPSNQTILWNVIQKIKLFQIIPKDEQEMWFKEIIGSFYKQNKQFKFNAIELQSLNKKTIEYMVQLLNIYASKKSDFNVQQKPPPQNNPYMNFQHQNTLQKPNMFVENSTRIENQSTSYSNEFVNRQKEYENMNKKETPPEPKFQEKIEDTVIENMQELVEQHMKQRELEIQHFSTNAKNNQPSNNVIKISENIDISSNIEEITNITNTNINVDMKKKVSWELSESEEIQKLKLTIENLSASFKCLQEEVDKLKKQKENLDTNSIEKLSNQPKKSVESVESVEIETIEITL